MPRKFLKLFVLSHRQELLDNVPDWPHFEKIHLPSLDLGCLQANQLGEHRAFLADLNYHDVEYLGFINARWNAKYHLLKTKIEALHEHLHHNLARHLVWAPWPTNCWWLNHGANWYQYTASIHPTMNPLLLELERITSLPLQSGRVSLWANDFICHRVVFLGWLRHFRKCFTYFQGKYGLALPYLSENMDAGRHPAYFYERVTTLFFANRFDIEIKNIP